MDGALGLEKIKESLPFTLSDEITPHFVWPVRVYLEDTDAGGIAYHATALKYFERARTEFVRSLGIELRASFKHGLSYVVHSLNLNYRQPSLLDECVWVVIELKKLGGTYMLFGQSLYGENGELKVQGDIKVACVALETLKPTKLPVELRTCLQSYLNQQNGLSQERPV